MSTSFLTYLWHYVVARLLYDALLRPVVIALVLGGVLTLVLRRRAG